MSGLSSEEKAILLNELKLMATASDQEIEKRIETLERGSKLSEEGMRKLKKNADKLIQYNKSKNSVEHITNKLISDPDMMKEQIRDKYENDPDLTFATATTFSPKGTVSLKTIDNSSIAIDENFEKRFYEKMDSMNFSGKKIGIIGTSATGFIVGQNIVRILAIPGNLLVRLGSNNELTDKDLAKVGIGAIEAALKNPHALLLILDGFSNEFSATLKQQAMNRGFRPENILFTNVASEKNSDDFTENSTFTSRTITPFHTTPFAG